MLAPFIEHTMMNNRGRREWSRMIFIVFDWWKSRGRVAETHAALFDDSMKIVVGDARTRA
jgi:hypothetical protein